ncbi:MAG: PilX N-terminal domain-containing pilus assembly protein [Pseudomonadota bacterium]
MGGNVRGVMLIVCLMFLLVISLTAAVTVRRAASSDAVAGNARTHTLALQAAEAGLLHCERLFAAFAADPAQGLAPAAAPAGAGEPFLWEGLGNWDGPSAQGKARRVPFGDSESGGAQAYFRRSPECMAQYYAAGRTATAVVTARGFGPEVAPQGGGQAAPRGTEVWLQSVMTVPADGRPASRAWRQIFPRTQ